MNASAKRSVRVAATCGFAGLALAAVLPTSPAHAGPGCTAVSGEVSGFAVPQFDASGQVVGFRDILTSVTGPLGGGTATADLVITGGTPGGVLMLSGSHQYLDTTLGIDVVTTDRVIVTPNGIVNNTLSVVSSGGGTLHDHGTIDLATGQLSLSYSGVVCG